MDKMELPIDYNDYTPLQKKYVEKFICEKSSMYYREQSFYDYINIKPYNEFQDFQFECVIMNWANDRIRIQYRGAIAGRRMIGKKWNDRYIIADNFDAHDPIHRSKLEDTERIYLRRSSIYKHEIRMDFDGILNGMMADFFLFSTG